MPDHTNRLSLRCKLYNIYWLPLRSSVVIKIYNCHIKLIILIQRVKCYFTNSIDVRKKKFRNILLIIEFRNKLPGRGGQEWAFAPLWSFNRPTSFWFPKLSFLCHFQFYFMMPPPPMKIIWALIEHCCVLLCFVYYVWAFKSLTIRILIVQNVWVTFELEYSSYKFATVVHWKKLHEHFYTLTVRYK